MIRWTTRTMDEILDTLSRFDPVAATLLRRERDALREAVDELWSLLSPDQVEQLDSGTAALGRAVHEELWHTPREEVEQV